jgi:hypothetical protein
MVVANRKIRNEIEMIMNPQREGYRTSGNYVILSQNNLSKLFNAKLTYAIVPKKAKLVGLTIYDGRQKSKLEQLLRKIVDAL